MTDPAAPPLHGPAAARCAGASFEPVTSGARSRVWRAHFDDDRADVAVKTAALAGEVGAGAVSDAVQQAAHAEAVELVHAEAARLVWVAEHLAGRGLAAPAVEVVPEPDDPDPVLVTAWLEGTVDPRLLRSPEIAVEAFGRSLASLHEASRRIDLSDCPFDASLTARLAAAARRVEAGLVDPSTKDVPYDRLSATELLEKVQRLAAATATPDDTDRVFVHGDLCVTNLVLDPAYSATVGALDWSHAGVGDRIGDLAVTARSLARNFSGEVLPDFFAAYGVTDPDLLRLETYVALEELF